MPFAKFQILSPCFFKFSFKSSLSQAASCPIVWIPIFSSFFTVAFPTKRRFPTGSGHIFFWISSGNRVCTLSGFSKSDAIFARYLFSEIPIFTVKPSSSLILLRILSAASRGSPNKICIPVISTNASSMEYCSTSGEYSCKSAINSLDFCLYSS